MPTPITGQGISASPKVDATLSNTSKNAVQNQAVANALAGAYDATVTYAVGDLCIYDGILYECTTAITTAEAWDATHWKTRNFGDTVSDLNRQLSDLEDTVSTTQIINSASGAIASFDDGADGQPIRKLVAQIEPVQDLHGYDNPWPAGGGKNKVNYSVAFPIVSNGITISQNDDGSISINGTATANTNQILMAEVAIDNGAWTISGVPTNSAGGNLSIWARNTIGGTEYERTYNGLPGTLNISTGSVYIYCTISSGTTVDNVKVYLQLESGSTATSYSPYSNICPISGHTGAEIEQTGKNLYRGTNATDYTVIYGGKNNATSPVNEDYTFKAGTYRISFEIEGLTSNPSLFFSSKVGGVWSSPTNRGQLTTFTFTVPENCEHFEIWAYGGTYTGFKNVQIELGSAAATDYEPYTGNQISVTFPTTIYGGEDEVISGKLKSTMGMVDMGTLDWTMNVLGQFFATLPQASVIALDGSTVVCSMYKSGNAYSATNKSICIAGNASRVWAIDSAYSDAATFKAAVSGAQLCYELAEPVEYTLTENEVETLYGTNNIWSSTGDTEVEYPCDTKLYIDGKLAELQATILENIGG